MNYISTRNNASPAGAVEAINLGMVPEGGLFVPETIPTLPLRDLIGLSYHDIAFRVLAPLLTDFTAQELRLCIGRAYTPQSFDTPSVISMAKLGTDTSVMELWHGPTAAFKDVALQLMPHFMAVTKAKLEQTHHTVILVATSGDTGKAALEGFRDCEGISIIVFYPENGVSEIQKLQMVTTEGGNTHVVAVKGNFDDCQNGVKALFSDSALAKKLFSGGYVFSSANSINWGRLCPQIVYYFHAYSQLVENKTIKSGAPVNFCVPTGNFGNILAAYYAKRMGLPIARLFCASNKNKVLFDFFNTGVYDSNRRFFRTISPSMDILISSNLERFLFEITGHDATMVTKWYSDLASSGSFTVDSRTKAAMDSFITAGWVDDATVLGTIGETYSRHKYVMDTHTAVAAAMLSRADTAGVHTVIDSTASPYKFSANVTKAISGKGIRDEFRSIERLHELTSLPVHNAVKDLRQKQIRHKRHITVNGMREAVLDIIRKIDKQ
jgi:threonine synthase